MLIVSCQKCGAIEVTAGSPNAGGVARVIWTCQHCGAGQIMDVTISKDARRDGLRNIIGGLALAKHVPEFEDTSPACDKERETGH